MEGDSSFIAALTEAIEQRRRHIEHTELPNLKEQFMVFHASLRSLIVVLVRKGLIQEDPYKLDQKISDIVMAEDTAFTDSELPVVVGVRMSQLDNVLEYANNYVEFSVQALDFAQLKKLTELVRYVAWDDLRANSPLPTTQTIAILMGRLRAGADPLTSGILKSALDQLRDRCREIVEQLKVVRAFQRERYKLNLRTMVFPKLQQGDSLTANHPESLKKVRALFSQSGMDGPFIPELVSEVIAEEFGQSAAERREQTLKGLRIKTESGKTKKSAPISLRQILINAIRSLAAASRSLDGSLERLRENAAIIQGRKRSFGRRVREWVDKVVNRTPARHIYELEFMDEATGTRHRESVDLDSFLEKLHKKAQVYGGILSKSGSLWTKMEKAGEDQLYQFINRELGDVHLIHRRANAFDAYFKAKTTQDEKRRLRGIKIELTTIRNSIAKASQLKHEYISRKEEQEQLKKLGIETEQGA
ncbi:MAG: hypothetical protein KAU31_13475 [Spirochaetaceae bacterium]|nr:hypothetical protein [Spirochaetaceae bacterium]